MEQTVFHPSGLSAKVIVVIPGVNVIHHIYWDIMQGKMYNNIQFNLWGTFSENFGMNLLNKIPPKPADDSI